MASLANFSVMPLICGVNRRPVSLDLVSLYSGVLTCWPGASSVSAHTYLPGTGRSDVGVGSHSALRLAGGLIFWRSAKELKRLYRNAPDSVIAYFPWVPWNQTLWAAIGTMPATSMAPSRIQPTRR